MKKYELTDQIRTAHGCTLYRIKALRDIPAHNGAINRHHVKAGDLGGWIQSEDNLSQDGDCWVADNAIACDNARVRDDAWVVDHAVLQDNAVACEIALVGGNSNLKYDALAEDECVIRDNAIIAGNARITGDVAINGNSSFGDVCIADNTVIYSSRQYITVGPIGSGEQTFTLYKVDGVLHINCQGASMVETEFVNYMIDEFNHKEFSAMLRFAHDLLD